MKVSIVVPVYNVKDLVIKCLESLHDQTLDDYEVIVVNDGSTDGSGELVDAFCADKEKFRVFHKENGGLMSAWMEGVSHATGEYLGFVDSDDYVDMTMFEKLYDCAAEYSCDIVMCDRYDVRGEQVIYDKKCVIDPGYYSADTIHLIHERILPTFNGSHITNARWNKLFRRELFMGNTKYCEHRSRICEDRFITPACVFSAQSFYYLKEPLYYYVLREGSNHSMPSPALQDVMEMLYANQKQMLQDKGLDAQYTSLVERANLNYLRLMIMRNFAGKGDVRLRKTLAKRILKSDEYRRLIKKYPNDMSGKLGKILRWLFIIKSPALFVGICSFIQRS